MTDARLRNYEENGVLEVSWLENGDLKILAKLPVTFQHPDTGETVWFNRIHGAYTGFMGHTPDRGLLKNPLPRCT